MDTADCDSVIPLDSDPDRYYDRLKVKASFRCSPVPLPITRDTPKPPGHMRLVLISDTHSFHRFLPKMEADVLIHAGDFTSTGEPEQVDDFAKWLGEMEHIPHKVVIAGNHDLTFDRLDYPKIYKKFHYRKPFDVESTRSLLLDRGVCTYLEESGVEIDGVKFYGSPQQPWFYNWAFNRDRGDDILQYWKRIPDDVDVLVTHGPPLGYGDLTDSKHRTGCSNLQRVVQQRVKPSLHVFGHIHEDYGVFSDGSTLFANASSCNLRYEKMNLRPPIYLDLNIESKTFTFPS
jgi:Icc-related predicted phosphoesterase